MLCFSTFLFSWQSVNQTSRRPCGPIASHCTSLANTNVVPDVVELDYQETRPIACSEKLIVSCEQANSTPPETQASLGRMDFIIECLKKRGLSAQATQLVCASWSKGTDKQYSPVWKKWCGWCGKEQIDPL